MGYAVVDSCSFVVVDVVIVGEGAGVVYLASFIVVDVVIVGEGTVVEEGGIVGDGTVVDEGTLANVVEDVVVIDIAVVDECYTTIYM